MQDLNTFRLIERISSLLRSEQRKKYAAIGLQPVHVQIMEFLSKCNRQSDTPAALSEYLGITKGTLSQSLQVLERKGYIAKTTDPDDGRLVHLSLLAAGLRLLNESKPLDVFAEAEEVIGKQSFFCLDEALAATLKALQTANNSKSFGLCRDCVHFSETDDFCFCRLTNLPLAQTDTDKICRGHTES